MIETSRDCEFLAFQLWIHNFCPILKVGVILKIFQSYLVLKTTKIHRNSNVIHQSFLHNSHLESTHKYLSWQSKTVKEYSQSLLAESLKSGENHSIIGLLQWWLFHIHQDTLQYIKHMKYNFSLERKKWIPLSCGFIVAIFLQHVI